MAEDITKIEGITPLRQSFDDNQTIQVCREAVLALQKENQATTKVTACIEQLGDFYLEEGVSISEILRGVILGIDDETPRLGELVQRFETKAGTVLAARKQAAVSYDQILMDDLEESRRSYEESPRETIFDPESFFWHYYEGRAQESIGCVPGESLSDLSVSLEEENIYLKQEEYNCAVIRERRRLILDTLQNLKSPIFLEQEESPLSQDKFDLRPVLKSDLGVFFRPERVLLRSQHGVGVKVLLGDHWKFVGHFEGGLTVNGTNQTPDGPETSIVSSPGMLLTFGGGIVFPNDIALTLDVGLAQDRNEYFSFYYEEIPEEYTTWNAFFDTTLVLNLKGFRLFAGGGTRGLHIGIGLEQDFDIKSAVENTSQKRVEAEK